MTRRTIADAVNVIEGDFALSVGESEMPAPPGWTWHKLTDVARLESGHTPSRGQESYWNGPIPWISIPDARRNHGTWITETAQSITQAGIDNSAARLLPKGTVCLSRTASVGYVTVMGRPMATSQDFVNWVCSPEIDPDYLRCLFLAEKDALLRFGKGSTHTTIYFPEVQAFRVCAPPLVEQRRIVAKLDALRARSRRAKEALDAVPALLDRLRQSILAAAFRGDLTADWREANPDVEPASELLRRIRIERRKRWEEAELAKMVAKGKPPKDDRWKSKYVEPEPVDESELPELPAGWCWASLDEVVQGGAPLCYGVVQPGDEPSIGVSLIRVQDLFADALAVDSLRRIALDVDREYERSRVKAGDVLISVVGTIGRVATVPTALDGANIARAVARIRVSGLVQRTWVSSWLSSPEIQHQLGLDAREVARKTLNIDVLARLPVALAPAMEQSVAVAAMLRLGNALPTAARVVDECTRAIDATDASILAAAFGGELLDRQSDVGGTD